MQMSEVAPTKSHRWQQDCHAQSLKAAALQDLQQPQRLLAKVRNLRAALATLDTQSACQLAAAADAALQSAATWHLATPVLHRPGSMSGAPLLLLEAVGAWYADQLLLDGSGRGVGYSEAR